ncbi:MAG TPA: glycosyltransferase [Acidimicrobiia bacterium]|nr:glycosyltransferase [Acidimicrobiia bacterium]
MEIHQLLVSASPGDAVTNAAYGFQKLLRRIGPSEIFAHYIHPRLQGEVHSLSAFERCSHPGDMAIYHASIGEPAVARLLLDWPGRLVLVYHNITPAEYFGALDPAFAQLLTNGRIELALLRDRVEMALAVSRFNAVELEAMGYRNVRVCPLPVDLDDLAGVDPDPATAGELAARDGPLVLFVGQMLPHKRPDLLVSAFHVLSTHLLPEANLALVGAGRRTRYPEAVQEQARELGLLQRCRMPGWVESPVLAAYYRAADVFATMSEHEGVCVPLLEAMRFDVPVVARRFGAVPETMGPGGIVLPPDDDPVLVAEALAEVLTDGPLRSSLVARGRARVADFRLESAEALFLSHLADVA